MKILLIEPGSTTQPHMGFMIISAILKNAGYEDIEFIPLKDNSKFFKRTEEYYKQVLLKDTPDFVLITCSTLSVKKALELAKKASNAGSKVLLGGPGATDLISDIKDIDYVEHIVIGESENIIVDVIEGKYEKKVIVGGLIKDLDKVPIADRSILNMQYYPVPLTIMSSRGCPYNCSYCSKPVSKRSWRGRDYKRVVDEIEFLMNKYKEDFIDSGRIICFQDDAFNINVERSKKIMKEIIDRRIKINLMFVNGLHVKNVDEELFNLMSKAGCKEVWFGIESGNDEVLAQLGKSIDKDMVRRTIRLAKKSNIETVGGHFIIGLPGENKNSAQETIDFAKELKLDVVGFNQAMVLPNTDLYNWVKKNGRILKEVNELGELSNELWGTQPTFETDEFTKKERIEVYKKSIDYSDYLIKKRMLGMRGIINFLKKPSLKKIFKLIKGRHVRVKEQD